MIKFTAFRTRKPRQFNYIPRHYDPEQEAREERRKQVLGISETDDGGEYTPGKYIRGNMRTHMKEAGKAKNSALPKTVFICSVLVGMSLWLWMDNIVVLVGTLVIGFIAARILAR